MLIEPIVYIVHKFLSIVRVWKRYCNRFAILVKCKVIDASPNRATLHGMVNYHLRIVHHFVALCFVHVENYTGFWGLCNPGHIRKTLMTKKPRCYKLLQLNA